MLDHYERPVVRLKNVDFPIVVELGCGKRKREARSIGIDAVNYPGVDIICDLSQGIPLETSVVDTIFSRDFIEHLPDAFFIMKEIWRVLKPDGIAEIIVPSTDGRGAFQDASHKTFWNENSFGYWCDASEWADTYRTIHLFRKISVKTVGLNPDGSVTENSDNPVKHVHAILSAVKEDVWLKTFLKRNVVDSVLNSSIVKVVSDNELLELGE